MKTQDLKQEEQQATNGGSLIGNGLLGNDDNMITGISQGHGNASSTDDSGGTSSSGIDYGTGSLLDSLDGGSR